METAVFKTGGKQYRVAVGDTVKIEKIKADLNVGDKLTFDEVLLKDDGKTTTIGAPTITGAKVEATLSEIGRNKKVTVLRYKAKSNRLKINGHRQPFYKVTINAIS